MANHTTGKPKSFAGQARSGAAPNPPSDAKIFENAAAGAANAMQSMSSLGAEFTRSYRSQLALSGDLLQQLASCASPVEAAQASLNYTQKSFALQSEEWRRLFDIGMDGLPHLETPTRRSSS